MALSLVVVPVTPLARGRARGQTPVQNRPPVFRSAVDYVPVDVVVTDGDDRPIADLTKDDFEIIERGRTQEIVDFRFVHVPLATPASRPDGPPPPPPDVATNAAPSPDSRLFVLVIDDLHIIPAELVPLKRIMSDFLDALSPDDEVAVVFVGHSNLGQNFTTDRGRLRRAIDDVREALGFGLDALGRSANEDRTADPRAIAAYARRADWTLQNIATAMAGATHTRRAIVYVTGGSLATTVDGPGGRYPSDFDELQSLYDAARRGNVPIYTLDPRGQAMPEDAVIGGIGAIGGLDRSPGEEQRARIAANIRQQQQRLAENAINTGGRAFTNQSDLTQAVREVVADNGSYYVLGYYPSPFDADGKYHAIDVTVKRPGARVRARHGYVASSSTAATDAVQPILDTALGAGVNVSGLALRATALPLLPGSKGMQTLVTIEVTYPPRVEGAPAVDDELQWTVLALDPDAKVKARSDKGFRLPGAARGTEPVTFLVDDVIDLPSQPLVLRVGLASRALGRAGSVQLDVDVPKPTDGSLQVSGVAIGLVGVNPGAMNASAAGQVVPFQPLTTREFEPGQTLRVFGRAFWKDRGDAVVTATIRPAGDAARPVGRPPQVLSLAAGDGVRGGRLVSFDTQVPLSGLGPGDYVLEIAARLGDGRPVTRLIPFEVR
ncbi:MAG: VWA domain-containing protein [Vicinamibacterales bacterium]